MQQWASIQAEGTSDVRRLWVEEDRGEEVGTARDELAFEVPAVNAGSCAGTRVACTLYNVQVALFLHGDHLGHILGVMAEVGIHDEDEVARAALEAVDIGGPQTQLASSWA